MALQSVKKHESDRIADDKGRPLGVRGLAPAGANRTTFESGGGPPHSKTLARRPRFPGARSVLGGGARPTPDFPMNHPRTGDGARLTPAPVGCVTPCAPAWRMQTLSLAGIAFVKPGAVVGRRRRAQDCPPYLARIIATSTPARRLFRHWMLDVLARPCVPSRIRPCRIQTRTPTLGGRGLAPTGANRTTFESGGGPPHSQTLARDNDDSRVRAASPHENAASRKSVFVCRHHGFILVFNFRHVCRPVTRKFYL